MTDATDDQDVMNQILTRHPGLCDRTTFAAVLGAIRGAGYIVLKEDRVIGLCPFRDPSFDIPNDTPCPKCGMLGHLDAEDKCVDTVARKRVRAM